MSVLASPAESQAPPLGTLQNSATVSEFKITPGAATRVEGALRRRVLGHRATAAILMLAALLAIAGGITLIFYAGDLAKQQRTADVESLVERANDLSKKADAIRDGARNEISRLIERPKAESDYYSSQVTDLKDKLLTEKNPDNVKKMQSDLKDAQDRPDRATKTLHDTPLQIQDIEKHRDGALAPIIESEKQLNEQITGSSAFLEYNSILIRVAAVLLIVFLVQTFITIFRYMTRLAGYYQARIDALQLAGGLDITITDLQRITTVFSPETYDFGKLPRTPTEQAVDLARTIIASQRKEE